MEGGVRYINLTLQMKKEPIINFEGMQFRQDRRARLPRGKQWQVRRHRRSGLGVSGGIKGVLGYILSR